MIYIHPTAINIECAKLFKDEYNLDAMIVNGEAVLVGSATRIYNENRLKEYQRRKALSERNPASTFDIELH